MSQARERDAAGPRSAALIAGELRLGLEGRLEAIEAGRREILAHVAPLGLDALVVNRLEVVFEEIVSNIVRHGFEPGSDQQILVRVAARPGAIELVFEDDGTPFDPLQSPKPDPFTDLRSARLGGLGIALVRRTVASLRYEALGAGGTTVDGTFAPRNRLIAVIAAGDEHLFA